MSIAVTGANGQLGRLVIAALKKHGVAANHIIALARHPEKVTTLNLGVTIREADYSKPATLNAALAGVQKLLLISSSEIGQRAAQHQAVIAAAKTAGVKLLVYTSLLHAPKSELTSLAAEHVATEKALAESGVPHAVLRNGWYIENYFGNLAAALKTGSLIGASGEGKVSGATRADYAEAAAVVLSSPVSAVTGKTYELAGDVAFTQAELAAELSRSHHNTSKKPIPYHNLSEADYAKALTEHAGLPGWLASALANWDAGASKGALFDDSKQLSKLIGRPTTSLKDALAAATF